MGSRAVWSRILVVGGGGAMLLGALDPLEGSVLVLLGSGMVTLGTVLNKTKPCPVRYWVTVFLLIAVGVAVMFGFSAVGGIGGSTRRSLWWALLILPYPIGWLFGMVDLARRLVGFIRFRHHKAVS